MKYFGDDNRSSLPIPGQISYRDKYDPIQIEHRELNNLHGIDEKPPYLTDEEWEQIRIRPGEMNDPHPEWDEICTNECCQEERDDRL